MVLENWQFEKLTFPAVRPAKLHLKVFKQHFSSYSVIGLFNMFNMNILITGTNKVVIKILEYTLTFINNSLRFNFDNLHCLHQLMYIPMLHSCVFEYTYHLSYSLSTNPSYNIKTSQKMASKNILFLHIYICTSIQNKEKYKIMCIYFTYYLYLLIYFYYLFQK